MIIFLFQTIYQSACRIRGRIPDVNVFKQNFRDPVNISVHVNLVLRRTGLCVASGKVSKIKFKAQVTQRFLNVLSQTWEPSYDKNLGLH